MIWRLSERHEGSLGLSCTADGLFLGRTPLLRRGGNCFAVRDGSELDRLFATADGGHVRIADRLGGLRSVAAALNGGEPALAAIAALHLRIPDLSDYASRAALEAEDRRIGSEKASGRPATDLRRVLSFRDFDPAKHPRWPAGRSDGGEFRPAGGSDGSGSLSPLPIAAIGPGSGPPLEEPPEIPPTEPATARERNTVLRAAAQWLARAAATAASDMAARVQDFLQVLEAPGWVVQNLPFILSYLDSPKTLDELQDAVDEPRRGYEIHHIVEEQATSRNAQGNSRVFTQEQLQSRENLVRVPYWKHVEISSWYSRPNVQYGGRSPREYLRGTNWKDQYKFGLDALRGFGVLK